MIRINLLPVREARRVAEVRQQGTLLVIAVAAALLGKWLDEKYATEPRYIIIALAIAFAMTALIVYKKAKYYGKEYAKLAEREKKDK